MQLRLNGVEVDDLSVNGVQIDTAFLNATEIYSRAAPHFFENFENWGSTTDLVGWVTSPTGIERSSNSFSGNYACSISGSKRISRSIDVTGLNVLSIHYRRDNFASTYMHVSVGLGLVTSGHVSAESFWQTLTLDVSALDGVQTIEIRESNNLPNARLLVDSLSITK